jgi:monofunctional biosynthetic peptidoglycan transglycosylase
MLNMSIEPWHAINDAVMGGLSSGGMVLTEGGLNFRGELSLENNGGFSSVRRSVDADLTDTRGIRLTFRGDGRSYQLRLRQDHDFDGIAWKREFATDGTVQVLDLAYAEFEPVFRGRIVKEAGAINPALIRQIGFLIADRLPGGFSLLIANMEVIR